MTDRWFTGIPWVRAKPGPSVETQRIRVLERELRRKVRALAEMAVLLMLKKTDRRALRPR